MLCSLCGCAPGAVSGSPGVPGQEAVTGTESPAVTAPSSPSESASAPHGNPNPIPALKDVTDDALGDVFWWCDEYSNGRMWGGETVDIWWGGEQENIRLWGLYSDQKTALIAALRNIQLLDRGSVVGMAPRLKFDIHLKDAETVTLLFIGDCVDFGEGPYHYKDYSGTGYPAEVYGIYISNLENESRSEYEDPTDLGTLMTALGTITPCPAPEALTQNARDAFTVYINSPGFDFNKYFMVVKTDDAHYVIKRFFTLSVCLGALGDGAFAELKDAENDQFGTHRSFSVTSGGETVCPPAIPVESSNYDSGVWSSDEASPNIADYAGGLQSVTLADDFSVWLKNPENTWYKITGQDGGTSEGKLLTAASFAGAPSGTCLVEVYVRTNERYIESQQKYEYTTKVYFFQVDIP